MTDSTEKGIVKYSSRDYQSILNDFYEMVPTISELWSPDSDSDPGVVLAKFVASCADMLGVNLDLQATEMYAPTVSQRKNAEKILALIGYDLGFYSCATTEVTFTNNSGSAVTLDFGFNGSNFCTLNAYTDITDTERVITYNILPMTSTYGNSESKSVRSTVSTAVNVFASSDPVTLADGESCTRVAVEGELRNFSVSVADVKANNYIITLPSQHIDTTRVWVKAKSSLSSDDYLETQWQQCASTAEFITPEPRFAVTYDSYSNAQVTISNYLNQLENYEGNYLIVYWIDCSGVIGCVGEDVLTNLLFANTQPVEFDSGDITVSNLSNTVELPNTYTVTGASPETAREAYLNSRNYINTWNSLITLPDYNRFLKRESGVDAAIVIDCQKALEYNLSIYNDTDLTDAQKSKKYITYSDFPASTSDEFDWAAVLNLTFDPSDPQKFVFATNFQRYTAMCFAIHNDYNNSSYGSGQISKVQIKNTTSFQRYKPPEQFISAINNDFKPLQSMAVDIQFGFSRIFNFYVTGQIYTSSPVSSDVASTLVAEVKEALALYYAPANRDYGDLPSLSEIIEVAKGADDLITFFDPGSYTTDAIVWDGCDIEAFNLISMARFSDPGASSNNIRVSPNCLIS